MIRNLFPTDWLRKNLISYKHFNASYEMSCIRNTGSVPHDEFEQIIGVGEEIRPVDRIRKELEHARINYRYMEIES